MRKFLFGIVSLVVISALLTGTMTGCKEKESESQNDTLDTTVVKPQQLKSEPQSEPKDDGLEEISVTGVAVDPIKSSMTVKTDDGEEIPFEFESLRDNNVDYYHSEDGDRVTVTYVKVEGRDSVISIEKAE